MSTLVYGGDTPAEGRNTATTGTNPAQRSLPQWPRALRLDPVDFVPTAADGREGLSKRAMRGGAATAAAFHLGAPLVLVLYGWLAGAFRDTTSTDEPVFEAEDVIEARFVELGKPLDKAKLPERQVPILDTAPSEAVAISKDADTSKPPPPPDKKKEEPPPKDATEDLLRRLGDRAKTFAEIAEAREKEGDPNGVEGGTATEATEGDLYRGLLYRFFRQGWRVPTLISDDERRGLTTAVHVTIGTDLRIRAVQVQSPSGNPLFDQSVVNRIDEIIASGTPIPPPPEEVAGAYLGKMIQLRFRGRDAS